MTSKLMAYAIIITIAIVVLWKKRMLCVDTGIVAEAGLVLGILVMEIVGTNKNITRAAVIIILVYGLWMLGKKKKLWKEPRKK